MNPTPRASGVLAVALLLLLTGCQRLHRSPGANVVLISIDTLRADHLSLYGYRRPTSPQLEELAREAVVFDRFFFHGGGTLPSHITMLTSLHPLTHGMSPQHRDRSLEAARVTLAEQLKGAGYYTAGFVDGGWLQGKFGFHQGFDLYDDGDGRLETILPKVNDWLVEHRAVKFFLFIHSYDVHSEWKQLPYECPEGYHDRYTAEFTVDFDGCREGHCASKLLSWVNAGIRSGEFKVSDVFTREEIDYMTALYDGCINYVDAKLGEFFNRLRELGVWDQTLILVTSDHGEEFIEHGMVLHDQAGYEELAHIPLIIKLPHGQAAGRRVHHLAAMADLMPTILDVLDLPLTAQAQGRSLWPTLMANEPVRDSVHMYATLRTERWKYLARRGELFDLEQDPGERHNLAAEKSGLVAELDRRLQELIGNDQQRREEFQEAISEAPAPVELTAEEVDQLRALGYLQ